MDNYVDKITNTINSIIEKKVLYTGLPVAKYQDSAIHKTNYIRLQKCIKNDIRNRKRDNWERNCDHMELSEGQDLLRKVRSVLNPK